MLLRRTAMLELRRVALVPRCRAAVCFSCGRAAATRHAVSNVPSSCCICGAHGRPSASCTSGSHSSALAHQQSCYNWHNLRLSCMMPQIDAAHMDQIFNNHSLLQDAHRAACTARQTICRQQQPAPRLRCQHFWQLQLQCW